MKYELGNKCLLRGVESKVAFINAYNHAYLVPIEDDSTSNPPLMRGVVFAILDEKGRDEEGNKGVYIVPQECAAV